METRTTTRTTTRTATRDKVFDDLTVAPGRYATTTGGRYATSKYDSPTASGRYAATAGRYTEGRYAATTRPAGSRYGRKRRSDRYGDVDQFVKRRLGHILVNRIIFVIPPLRTDGRLMELSSSEYETSFEEFDRRGIWSIGVVIDFDEAELSRQFMCCGDDTGMPCETHKLQALTIDGEEDTFQPEDCAPWDEEINFPVVIEMALNFRRELAADPEWVVSNLDITDLARIGELCGMTRLPLHSEISDAITNDPTRGLGGAALDYATWRVPGQFSGKAAEELSGALLDLEEMVGYRPLPQETFLLYSGSLPPGTRRQPWLHRPDGELIDLSGAWVISKATYTSDLTGKVVMGYRSLYLEPESPGTA